MTESEATTTEKVPTPALWAGLGLVLLIHVVLAWLVREPGITTRNDDAVYVYLSRAVQALQYRNLFAVDLAPHTQYPPAYPLVLAVLSALFGERLDLFLAVNILFSAAALGLLFDLFRRRFSAATAFLVLVPSALNPWLLRYSGSILAEAPYLLLSAVTLWLVERDAARARPGLATVTALAAALTRSVGVALPAALGLWALSLRQWRRAAMIAVAGAVVLGSWFAWMMTHPPAESEARNRSYASTVRTAASDVRGRYLPQRWVVARTYLTSDLARNLPLPPVDTSHSRRLFGLGAGVLLLAGLIPLWRRLRLTTLYFGCYVGVLLVWPIASPRFLAMILPFIIAAMILGAERLAWWSPPLLRRVAMAGLAGILSLGGLVEWRRDRQALAECDRAEPILKAGCFHEEVRTYFEAAIRSRDLVPPQGAILATHEAAVAYYSGRQTTTPSSAAAPTPSEYLAGLLQRNIEYVLLGHTRSGEVNRLAPRLAAECHRLDRLLFVPPHAILFRIRPPDDPSPDRAACDALAAYLADPPTTAPQRR